MPDYDLIVAGGGLAGLTAGLFGARRGLRTLVLEPLVPGGQTINLDRIEDFPGFPEGVAGYDLGPAVQEQAANAGAEFAMAEVEALARGDDGWAVAAGGERYHSKTVIVATGERPRPLGVPGEERLTGRGVSHCATCDGPLYRGRSVGVVGGGSAALHEALTLAGHVEKVIVLCDALDAQAVYLRRVEEEPKIEVRAGVAVEEVLGDQTMTGVRLRGGEIVDLAGLFVYVGSDPNTACLGDLIRLEDTRIPVDVHMRTGLPGLLAAGSVRLGAAGYALTSASDGAIAALAAHHYVSTGEWA